MLWRNEYKLGITIIDTQHKQLFRFSEELRDALAAGLKPSTIDELLKNIKLYVVRHFSMEEKYMTEVNYPGMKEQVEAHLFFKERFETIHAEFKQKGLTPVLVKTIKNELIGWINEHVTGLDQEFGSYYREHH